eukprot:TRINITY_DN86670_c0_g1_i1.p3 TRINITY_DN86670_c0_g1~~TRINITY_DN86670_c0_g1_i1.p3  ORF type:complete len:103 (+),score=7.22 TRINITY_DN86670_c0_g1_i1:59-367(+)
MQQDQTRQDQENKQKMIKRRSHQNFGGNPMRRTLITAFTLIALAGCSTSRPVYDVPVANAGAFEGAGDSLGMALFAEDVVLSKHPGIQDRQEGVYAVVPDAD